MPNPLLDQIELFSRRHNKQPIFYPRCRYTCRLGTPRSGSSPLQNLRPHAGYLWKVNADVWKLKCKMIFVWQMILTDLYYWKSTQFKNVQKSHLMTKAIVVLIWISWNVCQIYKYEVWWRPLNTLQN